MCGIATITLSKAAPPKLDLDAAVTSLIENLDHRGGDATGFLTVSPSGRIMMQRAAVAGKEFNAGRRKVPANTRALLVHTRMATQGDAGWMRNNHPVIHGEAYVVHNGHVWDDLTPRQPGDPEVDTFALAYEAHEARLRKPGETQRDRLARICEAMAGIGGAAAVGVAFKREALVLSARLSGSPLYSAELRGVRICASTREAVSTAFYALGLELGGKEVKREKTNGKQGRKRKVLKRWTEYVEDIHYVPEGQGYAWSAGMHTSFTFELPTVAATYQRYESDVWSAEERGYYYPDDKHDVTIGVAAAEILRGMQRCEICEEWSDSTTTYSDLQCCDYCMAAMGVSPDNEESDQGVTADH